MVSFFSNVNRWIYRLFAIVRPMCLSICLCVCGKWIDAIRIIHMNNHFPQSLNITMNTDIVLGVRRFLLSSEPVDFAKVWKGF